MQIIFKHTWIFFIITMFINTIIIRNRSKQYIAINPELKDGYDKLFKYFLIFGNIPWIIMGIGDLTGLTKNTFDFFNPKLLNPVVLIFHGSIFILWILGSYWIFFNNGDEFLAKHPGFFNFGEPSKSDNINKNKIKFIWVLMIIGGVFGEIMMWSWDIPTIKF